MLDRNAPGPLSAPAEEALELSQEISLLWECDSGSDRPCIAQIFSDGASRGSGRNPTMFALGVEMASLGFPEGKIERLLRVFNTRVVPPLPVTEIAKVVKNVQKDKYRPFSCSNELLRTYCIGSEDCPHARGHQLWKSARVSANGLVYAGWLPHLSAVQAKLYLGLYHIAILKGRGPKHNIPFTFSELESISGVSRKYHRKNLESLLRLGLIKKLYISQVRGTSSSFRFPESLPSPSGLAMGKGVVGKSHGSALAYDPVVSSEGGD